MSDISLSKAVRSNLLNLQSTAAQMGKTQERLATGLKVNSALDNPTNFFTASALNSRASDLGQLLDSVSNAVQTIAAALISGQLPPKPTSERELQMRLGSAELPAQGSLALRDRLV